LVEGRQYPEMTEKFQRFRFLLKTQDGRLIYKRYWKNKGIDITREPQHNIHDWLDPHSTTHNPILSRTIFHYLPRTIANERFELCMASSEMHEAAWRYGHGKQLMVDGTFGICNRRILLFIVMVIDENNHGIPVAFFFFSAPETNRMTSSGYDTAILVKLMTSWRSRVSEYGRQYGYQPFEPAVAITDTDIKERKALVTVWPNIQLLLCKFHLLQCWRNSRNKLLAKSGTGRDPIQQRLRSLERELIDSTNYEQATGLIHQEQHVLNSPTYMSGWPSASRKGLDHISYLSNYWMKKPLWESWSASGRIAASLRTGLALNELPRTTNHLESFNGLVKHHYIRNETKGGHRLRLDVTVDLFNTKVIPSIFAIRRTRETEQAMLMDTFGSLPGAANLLSHQPKLHNGKAVAYLIPDHLRDTEAKKLVHGRFISWPIVHSQGLSLTCRSSRATADEVSPLSYNVWLSFQMTAGCSCPDFQSRGGACKHIRAAIELVDEIQLWACENNPEEPLLFVPIIVLPKDWESATALAQRVNDIPTECRAVQSAADFIADLIENDPMAQNDHAAEAEAEHWSSGDESMTSSPVLQSMNMDLVSLHVQYITIMLTKSSRMNQPPISVFPSKF
jgi:hypothetical protein